MREEATSRRAHIPAELPRRPPGGTLVGRAYLRAALAERLRSRLDTDVVGPAGYGKTAVAAMAIRDVIDGDTEDAVADSTYPDGVVLLDLYALRRGDLNEAWSHLAHSFGAPELPDESPRDRARNACVGRRALVVIEGAEEAASNLGELLSVLSPEIVRLVLTRDAAQATVLDQRLNLNEELTSGESSELLNAMCPGVETSVAGRVYAALGGHPLALTWAGAALADPTGDVAALLRELEAAQLPKLHDPKYETRTLKWLYERGVRRLSDDARRVLAAIGSLAHGAFPIAAVEVVLGETEAYEHSAAAVRALARAGFIARVTGGRNEWTMSHALAYRFAREHHRASGDDIRRLADWCAGTVKSVMPLRTPDDFSSLRHALRHADALLGVCTDLDAYTLVAVLLNEVGHVERVGSLDISRSAVRPVEMWFDKLADPIRASHTVKRQRAMTHVLSGDIAIAEGDLGAARTAFETALRICQALAADDPANAQWQRDISLQQNRIGEVLLTQGDRALALVAFRTALEIRETLAALDPADTRSQRDLSISHGRIGDVLVAQGEGTEALAAFRRALQIGEALAARDLGNTRAQRDVSVSQNKIGKALVAQGDNAGALTAFRAALAIREALAERDPANTESKRDLSVSYNKIGEILVAQRDWANALTSFRTALEIRKGLVARDPANARWQRDLSYSYTRLASVHEENGDYDDALQFAERSLEIDEHLSALDPTNSIWQQDVHVSRAQVTRLRGLVKR